MVHGFAKQSGGHVDIYSELGLGTAISLYLPNAGDTAADEPENHPQAATNKVTGENILVVEDDSGVREITVDRLEHLGYRIVEARTGQEALDILSAGTEIDVMLTDMVMPGGMTGADLVQRVRQDYPKIRPIITSGYAPEQLASTDGIPWLRKPYTLADLERTLRELLH